MAARDIDVRPNSDSSREVDSRASKNKDEKVNKIVSGTVTTRKKTGRRKFFGSFFNEDIASVKDYVLTDVIVPAIKDVLADSITNSINMFLYGETRGRSSRGSSRGGSFTNYSGLSSNTRKPAATARRTSRTAIDIDDIILETRGEANDVLDSLDNILERYQVVTVADLYDLLGLQNDYTSNTYGWRKLAGARVRPVGQGYLLDLPRPEYLD